jgi:hypothetical protein
MVLKSGQPDLVLQPYWLMAIPASLYLLLGLLMAGPNWRWPVAAAAMGAAQLLLALLMGWGYSAVEGQPRDAYDALAHGLWSFAPGTVLQAGYALAVGAVLVAWLTRPGEEPEPMPDEGDAAEVHLPDLSQAEGPQEAVAMVCALPEVGAALIRQHDALFAAGAWRRDPVAALHRANALLKRTGPGLNTFSCDEAMLLVRWENAHTVALIATTQLPPDLAHELLRGLWAWEMVPEPAPE